MLEPFTRQFSKSSSNFHLFSVRDLMVLGKKYSRKQAKAHQSCQKPDASQSIGSLHAL